MRVLANRFGQVRLSAAVAENKTLAGDMFVGAQIGTTRNGAKVAENFTIRNTLPN